MLKLGDLIVLDFTVHNPTTGNVSDADELPTCEVFEGDDDVSILSPEVVKRAGKIGDYRVSIIGSTGNGFEVGRSYNVIARAVAAGVTAKSRIGCFSLDSKRNADLDETIQWIKSNVGAILETVGEIWRKLIELSRKFPRSGPSGMPGGKRDDAQW